MAKSCVNDEDVFTMKSYSSLLHPIILLVGKYHHFYDLISLFEWTHVRNRRHDPSTRVAFTVSQLRKIRKRHEKLQLSGRSFDIISECLNIRLDELGNMFNNGEFYLPSHADVLTAIDSPNIRDACDRMNVVFASLPQESLSVAASRIKSGNFDNLDFSQFGPEMNVMFQRLLKNPEFPSIASLLLDKIRLFS